MEAGKRQAAAYVCLFIPATEGLLLYHSLFFFFFSSFDHHHSVYTKAKAYTISSIGLPAAPCCRALLTNIQSG